MRAICTYTRCTKVTTNNWDIRQSVTVKFSLAIISIMARQIHMIELVLESAHQTFSDDIWYFLWQMTAPPGMSFDYMMEIACT